MTDPIADLLTRLRNSTRAGHETITCHVQNSKM